MRAPQRGQVGSQSLRRTIFVRVAGLTLLLVLLFGAGVSWYSVGAQHELERRQVLATARFIADRSALFLAHRDLDNLGGLIARLVQNHRAALYGAVLQQGQVVAGDVPDEGLPALDEPPAGTQALVRELVDDSGQTVYDAWVAVPEVAAVVRVGQAQRPLHLLLLARSWDLLPLGGLAALLGLLVAWGIASLTAREVRRAERALKASEQRYRTLFELAPDSIFLLDIGSPGSARIVEVNQAACRVHGYTSDEMVGQSIGMLDVPADRDKIAPRVKTLAGERDLSFEVTHQRRDGSTFPVEVIARRIDLEGEPVILSINRDISERRRAEDDKRRLEEQLLHAQKMQAIGQLAGGIAHDMNNILGSIMGAGSLLQLSASACPGAPEIVDNILLAARRGQDLTRNFLGFARKGSYVRERFAPGPLLDETRTLLARTTSRKIAIRVEHGPELHAVEADRSQLGQALMNLALNAVDAMDEQGTLRLVARNRTLSAPVDAPWHELAPGSYVQLDVIDTGCGMPPEVLARAFEPFFTTKPQGQGTGLGLAMVYGMMHTLGGAVHITSQPGQGTTVSLLIPAAASDQLPPAAPTPTPSTLPRPASGTILLIDDEKLIRWAGEHMLQSLGYEVLLAEDGVQGVALFERERARIDLVVLDLMMPNLDGAETFARLQAIDPAVRVLISSGFSHDDKVDSLLKAGVRAFIQKPYDLEQLAQLVAEVLAS